MFGHANKNNSNSYKIFIFVYFNIKVFASVPNTNKGSQLLRQTDPKNLQPPTLHFPTYLIKQQIWSKLSPHISSSNLHLRGLQIRIHKSNIIFHKFFTILLALSITIILSSFTLGLHQCLSYSPCVYQLPFLSSTAWSKIQRKYGFHQGPIQKNSRLSIIFVYYLFKIQFWW